MKRKWIYLLNLLVKSRNILIGFLAVSLVLAAVPDRISAKEKGSPPLTKSQLYTKRYYFYKQMSTLTGVPWSVLAAVDQYERTITIARPKKRPKSEGLVAIYYPPAEWAGPLNPDQNDTSPATIALFGGIGKDGNGDGLADPNDDTDALYTMASFLSGYGPSEDDIKIGLWSYYHNPRSVKRIMQFAEIYNAYHTLNLDKHVFPVPLRSNYSYRSTWGAARGWGGYRIHEGTDIFASYGVPVRSTCYGIIEIMGWNKYGGWRVGIRSIHNVYHYYAHLSGFNKKFAAGSVVEPGDVVGWVGSSGYGKPGTQGKFPPHLHYGLYRDNGWAEWAFDPYPKLRLWERQERQRLKKSRR